MLLFGIIVLSSVGTAAADHTTTSQPYSTSQLYSISQFNFTSQLHSTSTPIPSSMTEKGGGSSHDVSFPEDSPVPVVADAVVAVTVVVVLISLAVAAVACYKIKVLEKYNVEAFTSSNE